MLRIVTLFKVIEALLYPIGLIWAALIIAAIYSARKRRRGFWVFVSLAAFLTIFGCTPVPYLLLASLERQYVKATLEASPQVDAVVVLGGQLKHSPYEAAGFTTAFGVDRIATGVQMLLSGKARVLVFGGGHVPIANGTFSEGERVKELFAQWKLSPGEVITLQSSTNTRDEAVHFSELAVQKGWTNVVLVTSAYHLPRAVASFKKAGVHVHPVACDFRGMPALSYGFLGFHGFQPVPTTEPLAVTGLYIHEMIGRVVYKIKGWT
jgi:uncharacterized SAM-binding protein YcdF (DUF218 family)